MSPSSNPTWMRLPRAVASMASLESAPMGVLWVDPAGYIGYANAQVEALLGWPAASLPGQPIAQLARFWSAADWMNQVWPMLQNGPVSGIEGAWQQKSGGSRQLRVSLAKGAIAGQEFASLYLMPISRESAAEGAPAAAVPEFVESLGAGVVVVDAQLNVRYANPAFVRLVGSDVSAVAGVPLPQLIEPGSPGAARWSEVAGAGLRDWAFEFRNRQGRTFHLVVSSRPMGGSGYDRQFVVIVEDVTEHEQLRHLLTQHEHSFEHLAANMPGMIYKFVLNQQGQASFPYASPGCKHLWEIDPSEIRTDATPVVRLIHPDDLAAFQASVMKSAAELSPWEFEGRMITPSGREKWWHGASRPELSENGDIVWQGLLMDITHQKQIEAELKVAKQKAESAARAKADFLANMSHEIRTPMNGVIGMAELLVNSPLTDRQKHYVETIRSSAEVLLTIINDILDLSKMEAGKLSLHPAVFDLRRTLEDVAALLAPRAFEKGLEVVVRYDPRAPSKVLGDAVRIRQILTNLIGNAIKFTATGHVLVQVEEVGRDEDRTRLRFSVHDTGIGISPDALGRLFQKFEQADTSTSRRFGGTGLGLAISRQLVELMGGSMEVESELDRGSVFRFDLTLPAKDEKIGEEPNRVNLRGLRVLVVDDHPVNRDMMRDILKSWGVAHQEVDSGETALSVLRQARKSGTPFDLVLLDYQMPGMDGLLLASAIRAEPEIGDVHLAMLSSSSFGDDQQRVMAECGILTYLLKPLRQFELRQLLQQVAEARDLASGAVGPAGTVETAPAPVLVPASSRTVLRPLETEVTPESPAPQSGEGRTLRVLLAEDNEVNREIAVDMLKNLGCSVDCAENGLEAVQACQRTPYDLVLMDCQMPEMDGFEATRKIRELERDRHTHIVAMTAYAMAGDRERCLESGMDDYLSKPVTFAELRRVVLAQMDRVTQSTGMRRREPEAVSRPRESSDTTIFGRPSREFPLFSLDAGLAITGGSHAVLKKAIDIWWAKIPAWLTDLKLAIQRADIGLVKRTAHTMRGAAGNIGAIAIQKRAEIIENQVSLETLSMVANQFDRLVTDVERLRQATSEWDGKGTGTR